MEVCTSTGAQCSCSSRDQAVVKVSNSTGARCSCSSRVGTSTWDQGAVETCNSTGLHVYRSIGLVANVSNNTGARCSCSSRVGTKEWWRFVTTQLQSWDHRVVKVSNSTGAWCSVSSRERERWRHVTAQVLGAVQSWDQYLGPRSGGDM